jgi:3-methyl-2-oxobutanoate hydroxymethyltransferase
MGDFRRLEDAGAFAVECELIPGKLMSEIRKRTSLATISLGSGPDAEVVFLFTSDICGESPRVPRHARAYADLGKMYAEIDTERVRALKAFRADVLSGEYPGHEEVADIPASELSGFLSNQED